MGVRYLVGCSVIATFFVLAGCVSRSDSIEAINEAALSCGAYLKSEQRTALGASLDGKMGTGSAAINYSDEVQRTVDSYSSKNPEFGKCFAQQRALSDKGSRAIAKCRLQTAIRQGDGWKLERDNPSLDSEPSRITVDYWGEYREIGSFGDLENIHKICVFDSDLNLVTYRDL